MSPSISIREYIRWLPESASEPTTTVVLTSAENCFVDIRILKPIQGGYVEGVTESNQAPPFSITTGSVLTQILPDVLPLSRLDWAFAGTSSSEMRTSADGTAIVHSTWRHWVDSRYAKPEEVKDEGDMFLQTQGRTLERGSMVNPATDRMTEYEECWQDVEATTMASEGNSEDRKKVSTVLQLHDEAHRARGMVVRVGQFCQGIFRVGSQVSLERWEWEKSGGWKRTVRIGDLWVPCGVVLEGEKLVMGGEVRHGEYSWKVVEIGEF